MRSRKLKTIGDSFMATAGLATPLDNPALNCVRCGLDMVATAREMPASWQVRVGVHVGPPLSPESWGTENINMMSGVMP